MESTDTHPQTSYYFMSWPLVLLKAKNISLYVLVSYEQEFLSVPNILLLYPPGVQLNSFCLILGRMNKN